MNDPKKRFLMGNSITQDQWENQEEVWMLSRGTHHRSLEYEDGGDEKKTAKNGGAF